MPTGSLRNERGYDMQQLSLAVTRVIHHLYWKWNVHISVVVLSLTVLPTQRVLTSKPSQLFYYKELIFYEAEVFWYWIFRTHCYLCKLKNLFLSMYDSLSTSKLMLQHVLVCSVTHKQSGLQLRDGVHWVTVCLDECPVCTVRGSASESMW